MSIMESMTTTEASHLFVAWRDAADSRIHPVGRLTCEPHDAGYAFRYLNNVKSLERFSVLPGFPELDIVYRSDSLFPLFEVRIMSRRRPDYAHYVRSLGLNDENHDPFILLARSEGWKSTDRLEVFAAPRRVEDTDLGCSLFFLRGLRYHPGAAEVVDSLKQGDALAIRREPTNEVNPLAVQVLRGGAVLGHIPDYLVDHVHEVWHECGRDAVEVTVEHVNPDTSGSHMRLLCRLESCWPDSYEPFSDGRFLPLIAD